MTQLSPDIWHSGRIVSVDGAGGLLMLDDANPVTLQPVFVPFRRDQLVPGAIIYSGCVIWYAPATGMICTSVTPSEAR